MKQSRGISVKILMTILMVCLLLPGARSQENDSLFDRSERRTLRTATLAGSALLAGSFLADEPLRSLALDHQTIGADGFTRYANYLGDKRVVLSLNAALLSAGYLTQEKELFHTSWNAFKSIVSTALITEGLKHTFGRSRPYTGEGSTTFNPFPPNRHAFKSLPSGHTSLAFAFFTPFAEKYSRWIYVLPASVAFSRVYKDKHWASDVALGAAIGFFTGYFFQKKDRAIEVSFNRLIIRF